MSVDEFPSYKPSVFYFRKLLHESTSTERAITGALIAASELEHLKTWCGGEVQLLPAANFAAGATCLRDALRQSGSHAQAILLGLFVCHELEQLKAFVREAGLIPPKWIVAPEEAEEKGWRRADAI